MPHQVNKVIYPRYFLWWSILKLLHGKQWWCIADLFGVEVKLKLFLQFWSDFHASRPSVPELTATEKVHWNFTFIVSFENRISLKKGTGETLSESQSYLMSICDYFLEIFKGYFLSEYYKEIMLWTINLICVLLYWPLRGLVLCTVFASYCIWFMSICSRHSLLQVRKWQTEPRACESTDKAGRDGAGGKV